jgi:hypothetical protein
LPKAGGSYGVGEVQFLPRAREEFLFAAQYYESEHPGLGDAFIDEVERAGVRIASFPEHGSPYLAAPVESPLPVSRIVSCTGKRLALCLSLRWCIIVNARGTGVTDSRRQSGRGS